MRFSPSYLNRLLTISAVLLFCVASAAATPFQENKEKSKPPQLSEGERKAAKKISDAKDTASRLAAAAEFINKFPKSVLRPKLSQYLIEQINQTTDTAQRITFAESYLGTFNEANETKPIYPILIDAYISAKRTDDAFNAAGPWLELNPNEVDVLYLLAVVGADEARRQNQKYLKPSQQYGTKAIELFEADKRPEGFTPERWSKSKAEWLPMLYQAMGLLSVLTGDKADAMAKLEKAVQLGPNDPFNYVLLSSVKNDIYNTGAKQMAAMPAGPNKTEAEKKLIAQLDEIIELYAHALGLMEGKPQYQQLHDQLLPSLADYYKYRHKSSTDGMQELINKYKQPVTP